MFFSKKVLVVLVMVVLFLGIGIYFYGNSFANESNPNQINSIEETDKATKEALFQLSEELQNGTEGVEVLESFEETQSLIFKEEL